MKLGLVVPRYGEDVVGGIEHWLRLLCEHLVAMKGWDVRVFTTCAVSAATWADELAPGISGSKGSPSTGAGRCRGATRVRARVNVTIRRNPGAVSDAVAQHFVDLVGPVCPDVLDDAAASDCDLVAVTPYLFWPAVHGTPRLGRRVIFHSAAHDEAELHLPIMGPVFEAVGGFAYNSYSEQALVERTFPVAHLPASVIGATVVAGSGDPELARAPPSASVRVSRSPCAWAGWSGPRGRTCWPRCGACTGADGRTRPGSSSSAPCTRISWATPMSSWPDANPRA